MSDPAFKRTRENMMEFSGASNAGKALRDGFANTIKLMGDPYLSSRISGIMRRIISVGAGKRGEREIDVVSMRDMFKGLELNKILPFRTIFYAPYSLPTISASRNVVDWTVVDFATDQFISAPLGATHFKLVLAAGYVSNYQYNPAMRGYEPVDDTVNSLGGTAYSSYIPLGNLVGSDTVLQVDLTSLGVIPASSAIFTGIGIIFYQEINGDLYELAQANAMMIPVAG
ncbi:hypothetical protein [Bizionia arctica]|nr:hypothetical protein [Bizionia arctica]